MIIQHGDGPTVGAIGFLVFLDVDFVFALDHAVDFQLSVQSLATTASQGTHLIEHARRMAHWCYGSRGARHGLQTAREGEAPAHPRAREILDFGRVSCRFRLGRSLALPKQAAQTVSCAPVRGAWDEDMKRPPQVN